MESSIRHIKGEEPGAELGTSPLERVLPGLLVRNARKYGEKRTALREKEYGIWQAVSWQRYLEHVRNFSLGLVKLGLQKGDKVAIIGDNRPEWVYAELAAQAAGAVPLGIYQDSILTEVAYVINHSDSKFVVAEDQEQVDKILDMREELPNVKHVIYTDPKGMRGYDDPLLIYFTEVEEMGRQVHEEHPDLFVKNIESLSSDDVAIIAYTSGTTGFPKGVVLTHRNLLKMALNLHVVDPKKESDEFLSFLPLPWIGEQMMAVSSALAIGFTVNFPEEPETAMADLYEIGPHVVFSPPRVWEGLCRQIMVKHLDASPLKRFVYDFFMPIGYRWADFKFNKEKPPWYWKLFYGVAWVCLFRALKDRLGFSRIRSATTGGAALGPDVFRFFHALGVNLKQIYGQTEISGISCIHRDGDVHFDTVGKPIPETEIKISETGEILSRSPAVFQEYYKSPEATEETKGDGWLHSGDAGYITEASHLVVIDRVKDLMKMVDGTKFSPMFIENKLKFCPFVVEAVVVGHELPYITAMICIDYKHTGKWAEEHQIGYTTYTDLASKPEVYDLIEKEVWRVNKTLPEQVRIKKFTLLYKELDADDEELTRTKKIRRGFIAKKYREVIDALYSDKDELPIKAEIRYQDGRIVPIETTLHIRKMKTDEEYERIYQPKKTWMFWKREM